MVFNVPDAVEANFFSHDNSKLQLAERMEGAEPCHDYKDKGAGPDGCW